MKSLRRLFIAVAVPFLIALLTAGCSGIKQPPAKTLTSIAVTPATPAHLKVGATQQFTATGTFSDGTSSDISATVTWNSGTTATATISATGLATGVAAGTTQITASQAGVTSSPAVTLTVFSLTSIAVTPATPAHLKVGATQQFTATGTFSDGTSSDISATVTWNSGTTATATISATGLATGVAAGTTQITASQAGVTSTPDVTLTVISLTSIAITPNPASVAVASTISFTATGTFSDASTSNITTSVTWSSSPTSSATIVATTGVATGVANGTAQISATLGSVVAPSITLTVGTGGAPVPVKVIIQQVNPTIPVGGVEDFTVLFGLSDGTTAPPSAAVTWSSGTTATATILTQAGIASGIAAGTTTITATSGTLTAGTTLLTVQPAVPRFTYTISPIDGVVSPFALNSAAGALAPLPTLEDGGLSLQLVFEPSGRFAYAPGSDGNIRVYSVDPVSGVLTSITGGIAITSFVGVNSSIGQSAVDPTGQFLYVVDGGTTNLLNAFKIDGTTGALSTIASSPTIATGSGAFGIAVTPNGKYVYVTNNGDSTISAYKIGSDGGLTSIVLSGSVATTLNVPEIPAIDPTSTFLYVPNLSAAPAPGTVSGFTIAADGTLALIGAAATTAGVSPFGTAIDPAGKFLFVTNSGDGTVSVFPIGGGGALGTAQNFNSGSGASSTPAGIAVDPSGAFAATVNNAENTITFYGLANGVLTTKFTSETRASAEFVSFYAGTTNPAIGPSNVFAANSGSGNISGFTATSSTGVLGTGTPTTAQAGNSSLAADITGNLLYSVSPTGMLIGGFSVTPSTAAIAALTSAPFALTPNTDVPSDIATEPSSRTVYVADSTANAVDVFTTGATLTSVGTNSFTSAKAVAVDPQGVFIIVFGNGSITSAGISGFTGTLVLGGAATTLVQAGNWTSGAIDPTGHWIVALDSTGKALQSIAFTPVQNGFAAPDGTLTATGVPFATAGVTAPSSVAFDPLGSFVFVSDATNGTVTAFAFNEFTGAITATGKSTTVSPTGTGKVSIDASGTYLYAAVTGNGGSTPSGVNAYKINSDGSLTLVAGSPFATGAGTSGTAGVAVTSTVQ
jgi:trimeric autotransporter adhesin